MMYLLYINGIIITYSTGMDAPMGDRTLYWKLPGAGSNPIVTCICGISPYGVTPWDNVTEDDQYYY